MRNYVFVAVSVAMLVSGAAFAQTASEDIPQPEIIDGRLGPAYTPLVEQLRGGGHVLLFRHDRTILSGLWDFEPHEPGACDRERNLSQAGEASARAIGDAIQQLGIPISRVVTSTYCRSVDSAVLMFGGVHLKTGSLIGADGKTRTYKDVRADVTRIISEEMPKTGVLVLVGHHGTIDAFTTRMLDEGDSLILKPGRRGAPEIVAHMPAARWEEIARDLDRFAVQDRSAD